MNTPVSFEIAKLLKEKGFDKSLDVIFNTVYDIEDMSLMKNIHHSTLVNCKALFYHAPTIADVVMWLYEKHGIWISVVKLETYSSCTFRHNFLFKEYNSPTEAYEAAIEFTLKNLI